MQFSEIPLTIAAVMGLVSLTMAQGGITITSSSFAGPSTPTGVVDGAVMSILPLAHASPYMLKEMDDSYLDSADYKYAYESQYPSDYDYDKETDEYYGDYFVSSYASPTAQFYGSDVPTTTVTSTSTSQCSCATAAPTGFGNSLSNGTLSSGSYNGTSAITNGTTPATNATLPLTSEWDDMHSGAGKNGATTAAAIAAAAAVLALGL